MNCPAIFEDHWLNPSFYKNIIKLVPKECWTNILGKLSSSRASYFSNLLRKFYRKQNENLSNKKAFIKTTKP